MIVSHRHRLILLKTHKTAGTSIELAVRSVVTDEDAIVTPVSPEDELLRFESCIGPRNYLTQPPPWRWRRLELRQLLSGNRPTRPVFRNHMKAEEVAKALPHEWAEYTKVAFVRNPWDYVVSRWYWEMHRRKEDLTIDDVLDRWDMALNWKVITIGGRVAVDHVYRYENLDRDIRELFAWMGETPVPLPRAKAATERKNAAYVDVLTPAQIARIATICADEIEHFGYRPVHGDHA